jgi:hypothetical protein
MNYNPPRKGTNLKPTYRATPNTSGAPSVGKQSYVRKSAASEGKEAYSRMGSNMNATNLPMTTNRNTTQPHSGKSGRSSTQKQED